MSASRYRREKCGMQFDSITGLTDHIRLCHTD